MSEQLKPCPFCGSEDIRRARRYCECNDCEAMGPDALDGESVADAWNCRANDQIASQLQDAEKHVTELLKIRAKMSSRISDLEKRNSHADGLLALRYEQLKDARKERDRLQDEVDRLKKFHMGVDKAKGQSASFCQTYQAPIYSSQSWWNEKLAKAKEECPTPTENKKEIEDIKAKLAQETYLRERDQDLHVEVNRERNAKLRRRVSELETKMSIAENHIKALEEAPADDLSKREEPLKKGDIVQSVIGGPKMIVVWVEEDKEQASLQYWNESQGTVLWNTLPLKSLKRVEADK